MTPIKTENNRNPNPLNAGEAAKYESRDSSEDYLSIQGNKDYERRERDASGVAEAPPD
jgi:hypothetical protein